MKNLVTLALMLTLRSPAAAGLPAPQLPPLDAAAARALPLETGNINAAVEKDFFGGPRVHAEGKLFSLNRSTGDYAPTGRTCSVTLEDFRSYLDTEHGSPREVVSARYRLEGFADLEKYTEGTAVGGAPDAYSPYVSLQNYLPSGLTKGVDVKIFIDNVSSAPALLARPARPESVYVTKENSMSSYFGGDGVKWGYWCDLRGARP